MVSLFMYVCMCVGKCIYTYQYILVRFPLTYPFTCFLTLSSNFLYNENKAFLLILCHPSHCWCYSDMSAVIFQIQFLYFNF